MKFEVCDSASVVQPCFWRVVADNGRELAKSETLEHKADALSAAQTLKDHANDGRIAFSVIPARSGAQPWTWHATTGNYKILVASSETYRDQYGAQNAIDAVKRGAPFAVIEDKTRASTARRW